MATCLFLDNYEYMIELLNERIDVNGCSKFIVTENEIVNKIVFDESNNEIYIDGVEIDISSESVCEPPELQAYGEFTYYGTTYQNVTLEQKVRNTTQSVLFVAYKPFFLRQVLCCSQLQGPLFNGHQVVKAIVILYMLPELQKCILIILLIDIQIIIV